MRKFQRIIILVLDSVGIGSMPDSYEYGDSGANTLSHIGEAVEGLNLPNLQSLGLGNIAEIKGVSKVKSPKAFYGKLALKSKGKDTTTGHWEIAGVILEKGFKIYQNGFPKDLIDKFISESGCKGVLVNQPASGTEVIAQFGEAHLKTHFPIVYTSADSVFQIAAHEAIIPVDILYKWCEVAYKLISDYQIARVIARPFTGKLGSLTRTERRKDFTVVPSKPTLLDKLQEKGIEVITVGKVADIFSGKGVSKQFNVKTNHVIMDETIRVINEEDGGLIFSNLVDFDMKFGHRRDPSGYAKALEDFDKKLPILLKSIKEYDLLIITADHGCDPTHVGTDHTREYVPLLVYSPSIKNFKSLGTRSSLSDIGETVSENFGLTLNVGKSFLKEIFS